MRKKGYNFVILTILSVLSAVSCKREIYTGVTEPSVFQNGRIFVNSNPKRASIYLNGRNTGQVTPDTLKWLDNGTYDITLKLNLYLDTKLQVAVNGGDVYTLFNDYSDQANQKGSIICNSQPSSAKIYLNGAFINQRTPYTITGLTPGYYWVQLTYPLCRSDSLHLTVTASSNTMVNITLDDTSKWVSYAAFNSPINSNYLSGIVADNKNVKWISNLGSGINSFDGVRWTKYTSANSLLKTDAVNCLAVDAGNNLWVGLSDGIMLLIGSTWIDFSANVKNASIFCAKIDKSGNLWLGTNNGLYKFDGTTWQNFTPSNSGIASTMIMAIDISDDGKIWAGTNAFGISVFDGNHNWQIWNSSDMQVGATIGNIVSSIAAGKDGVIWVSFSANDKLGYAGGVCAYSGGQWNVFTAGAIPTQTVKSIYVDQNNTKWFCTQSGLGKYTTAQTPALFTKYNTGLLSSNITGALIDNSGDLWITTNGGGAEKIKKGNY